MFIFWTGWGILAALIPFAGLILVEAILGKEFYQSHVWVQTLAILLGAAGVWYVGNRFNNKPGRVVVDKETGKELELKSRHSLFFIPMQYWSFIIAVLGIILLVTK